jgi:S-adenosylmethionine:tRNA ribosyltransferase-isomerase
MSPTPLAVIDFHLPPELEAHEPPEARGLGRDQVRLLVSHWSDDTVVHGTFTDLPEHLRPGDLLVVNTSGTLAAAVDATRADGTRLELHLSTRLPGGLWLVELRRGRDPFGDGRQGELLAVPGGATVELLSHFPLHEGNRLWLADVRLPAEAAPYLVRHGRPIRYAYVERDWPLSVYQTVYATEPGSAEMPSAGRPFTAELLTRLMAAGVAVAPLLLHTGVSSPESHEPPYPEWYRVPASTARLVNATRAAGGRVVAVGTTVVRALETVADATGTAHPGEGLTDLVVTADRGVRVVGGMLTGWHEPQASHLAMLEAVAGRHHLEVAYRAALNSGYLWHEFGDLHLLLP